ncbi:hypothetical protein SM87_05197 [Klebsiella pneumoniae]|jgi:putative colanic acid biosynthesis acetyltransferase WcaB|nr:hypothetical protein SM87_05197 [Klebsiella pneumoniae]
MECVKSYLSILDVIKEVRKNKGIKAKLVIFIFRCSNYFTSKNLLVKIFGAPFVILNKVINEILFCVEIPYKAKINKGLVLWHPHCIVINAGCNIGENFVIRQCCTLGANKRGMPVNFKVGNNVAMGINSAIISDDIVVGNNVIIGAGVILMQSVEGSCYVINQKSIVIKPLVKKTVEEEESQK